MTLRAKLASLPAMNRNGPVALALVVIAAACWVWIAPMCLDMYGSMSGAAAWMMTDRWDGLHLLQLWAMWVVMMAGMMLPSLVPSVVGRTRAANYFGDSSTVVKFVSGYLAVWIVFSTILTVLHRLGAGWTLVSPMMEAGSPKAAAAILLAAGIYQFTPWKSACLGACRKPNGSSDGRPGGYLAGMANGLGCVGCCWALMLVLFAGGVMRLWLNVVLTALILAEKVFGSSWWGIRLTGAVLLASGIWELTR